MKIRNFKKRMVSAAVILSVFTLMFSFCGCKKEEPEPEPEVVAEEEPEPEPEVVEEPVVEEYTGPRSILTGLPISEELSKKRPIAIMTENTKMCLPQYGLNEAGVIYEAPMEGGYSRLMAIYDDVSGRSQLGNVRSTRPYFIWTANEYDAILFHCGQSIHAKVLLDDGIIDDVNGVLGEGEIAYFRTSEHKIPHNMYTSEEAINKGIEYKKYRTELKEDYEGHFKFAKDSEENTLTSGEDCVVVKPYYPYNKPGFIYDAEKKQYKRYQFGDKQVDHVDNDNQVTFDNIIIEYCRCGLYPNTEYVDASIVNADGVGKFLTRGKMIDIKWQKGSDSSITHFYDNNGNEIELNQGRTWICIADGQYIDKLQCYATEADYEAAKQ